MQDLLRQIPGAFADILTLQQYGKGQLLHRAGERCNTLFLVKTGAVRSFYLVEGRDVTAHFALEYGLVGAVDSIVKGQASRYSIEALEPSAVYRMEYTEMEAYLRRHPEQERLARQVTQLLYLDLVERLEGMTFLSARARYEHLQERYPGITQRVSLGHIASYLGITQETLSRVRRQC
jgi:CRP-like cAMP-binding protein